MKTIKVVVEIPNKSQIKYEYDRFDKKIKVDRILRGKFRYPANYGFIPNTLDYDGDELDVLIYSSQTFFPGVEINARIVGLMEMIDSGETDNKLIAVHADDYQLDKIQSLSDVPSKWLKNIKYFFNNYKNWKGKDITQVKDFKDVKVAEKELNETIDLFKKYGKLPKKTFILKMKKLFPKKYT